MEDLQQWRTTGRKIILDRRPRLLVEEHSVALPNGDTIDDWTFVTTPDYINILPVTDDGDFLVFRQVRELRKPSRDLHRSLSLGKIRSRPGVQHAHPRHCRWSD